MPRIACRWPLSARHDIRAKLLGPVTEIGSTFQFLPVLRRLQDLSQVLLLHLQVLYLGQHYFPLAVLHSRLLVSEGEHSQTPLPVAQARLRSLKIFLEMDTQAKSQPCQK